MYYQNYDDYMRDVFYFNQMPNQNMGFQGFQNPNSVNMNGNMPINSGNNMNTLYPSIYRIVQPVVVRVVNGNNSQFLTEDNLSSMADTVYNIVEGDIMAISNTDAVLTSGATSTTTSQGSSNSTKTNAVEVNTQVAQCNNQQNATVLLKDLIKILIIKEWSNRNNRRFSNNNMFNQYCPNYYDQRYMF